ncbi:hypothetical protein JQN72_13030 [Phycicoccus sp. CSK15P-2]|uniref:hypothetical protein n=1 Tax=Phycicoccus sp. CSK15P-2 TaxID=2807627 RepID=UPI0019522D9C|nr:hypothetical protein [Phycicoccus sp. CSK15P-2]MBM6405165.1 hypothetical protein [Phycicoccus sp. CSK15P-2]
MSPDIFEDELRGQLRSAADAEAGAFLDIDTASVIGSGARIIRRRRMAAAGGTLALAVVAGLGAWAVLAQGTPDALDEVPATQSGTPTPSATATGVVEARVPDGAKGTVLVRLDTDRRTLSAELPGGGAQDRAVEVGTLSAGRSEVLYGRVSEDPLVVVGVLPAGATSFSPVISEQRGVSTGDAELAGTGYRAFVVRGQREDRGTEVTDVYWTDGRAVRTADGRTVESAAMGDRIAYHDQQGGMFGVVTPEGWGNVPTSDDTDTGLPPEALMGVRRDASAMDTTYAVLLPPGAEDVSVDLAPDATLEDSTTSALGDRATVMLARLTTPPESEGSGVTQVHWTDATGRHDVGHAGALTTPGSGVEIGVYGVTLDGATTVHLVRFDDAGRPVVTDVDASDLPAEGRLVECLPDGGAVCAALPDEAKDITLLDVLGRELGGQAGWDQVDVPGAGVHVVVASPGAEGLAVAQLRWTGVDGRTHTLGFE